MSELEELKARAAGAQEVLNRAYERGFGEHLATELKADLDRAIALAKKWEQSVFEWHGHHTDMEASISQLTQERDKAIAAAKALREQVQWWEDEHGCCSGVSDQVLADTAWLEDE